MCIVFGRVQLFVTPWTVARLSMGILQERILELVAMSSSRESSQPRDGTLVSCIAGLILCHLSHQGSHLSPDKMWSTGEGNGKPLHYSCLENAMSSMKR